MTAQKLRSEINEMTKAQMIELRDQLESNWDNSKRELMQVLSLGCIKKFNTTISNL